LKTKQESLGFLVADVSRLLRRAFEKQLQGSGISLAQARTLVYVARHEGVRQIDLAELLEIQPIRLARLIDQLEKMKLVERRPSPDDRRAYLIQLLPGARTVLAKFEETANTIRTEATKSLSAAKVAAMMRALNTIRNNLHTI
jgi:DNA-binding MarR family transcriptional regulator